MKKLTRRSRVAIALAGTILGASCISVAEDRSRTVSFPQVHLLDQETSYGRQVGFSLEIASLGPPLRVQFASDPVITFRTSSGAWVDFTSPSLSCPDIQGQEFHTMNLPPETSGTISYHFTESKYSHPKCSEGRKLLQLPDVTFLTISVRIGAFDTSIRDRIAYQNPFVFGADGPRIQHFTPESLRDIRSTTHSIFMTELDADQVYTVTFEKAEAESGIRFLPVEVECSSFDSWIQGTEREE